jgi:hypothetical protein
MSHKTGNRSHKMADLETEVQSEESNIIWVPIPKAGKDARVKINTDEVHLDSYRQALYLGFKELANRKMTKLASTKDMQGRELEEQKAAIMAVAEQNVQDIVEGNIRRSAGSKVSGVPQAVRTEAMRQIKVAIKAQLKAEGKKISYIPAKEITRAAKEEYEANSEAWNAKAKATLQELEKAREGTKIKVDIKEDTKLIAKAEQRKAQAKTKGRAPVQRTRPEMRVQ